MREIKGQPLPIRGHARRALVIAAVFALLYTLWEAFSVYYFPGALNAGRRPMIERLVLFLLCGAAAALCLLLTRKDGSAPAPLLREMTAFRRDPVFWIAAVWFIWACAATVPAVRERYVTYIHNSSFLFDQFINFLILFPLGYLFARRRDDRLLVLMAAVGFLCFLPYILAGTVLFVSHRPISLLGRMIEWGENGRLRLGGNPNTGGIFGALAFTSGLFLLSKASRPWARVLLAVGEALVFFVLLLTGSRGGILSASAGALYYGFVILLRRLAPQTRRISRGTRMAIAAAVLLMMAAGGILVLRRMTGRELVTDDPSERAYLWNLVLHEILGSPHLLAHGASSAGAPFLIGKHYGLYFYNAHNQLLEVWLGQGTPALCLFLAFLALVARQCLRLAFHPDSGEDRGIWTAGLFVLTLFLNSMVEVILVDTMTTHASFFCFASGTVCGAASLLPKNSGREEI